MQMGNTIVLEENISTVYENLIDSSNCIWRRDLKEVKQIDKKHFMEYTYKNHPTFYTVLKHRKNKYYTLELVNNQVEGVINYQFDYVGDKTKVFVQLDVQILKKPNFWYKNYLKRKWKIFLLDLQNVGK